MFNLQLSQRLHLIQCSRDSSRLVLLNGEETDVSGTIYVLVIREMTNSD